MTEINIFVNGKKTELLKTHKRKKKQIMISKKSISFLMEPILHVVSLDGGVKVCQQMNSPWSAALYKAKCSDAMYIPKIAASENRGQMQ